MYKKKFLFLMLSIICQLQALPKKPWTFMTYIAGDNSLAGYVNDDILEMKQGANDNVNILVYANVKENRKKLAKKIIVTKNQINVVGVEENLDSGSPSTFLKAINWTIANAPSDYIAIGLWDHGSGMLNPEYRKRGICFDDTTGNFLNDKDLKIDLEEAVKLRGGRKIDILFFDACLMANLECNVTWADYANFIVASEQTIPGEGFNYKFTLNYLSNETNPKKFAFDIVKSYKQNYANLENDYTLSAVSTQKIKQLANNLNSIAQKLLDLIKIDSSVIKIIKDARNNTIYFQETSYIDLGHFYANLLANLNRLKITKKDNKIINELRNSLVNGMYLIKQCVINNVTGSYYSSATGMSIYFPPDRIDPSYSKLYWTEKYPQWLEFLKRFVR